MGNLYLAAKRSHSLRPTTECYNFSRGISHAQCGALPAKFQLQMRYSFNTRIQYASYTHTAQGYVDFGRYLTCKQSSYWVFADVSKVSLLHRSWQMQSTANIWSHRRFVSEIVFLHPSTLISRPLNSDSCLFMSACNGHPSSECYFE